LKNEFLILGGRSSEVPTSESNKTFLALALVELQLRLFFEAEPHRGACWEVGVWRRALPRKELSCHGSFPFALFLLEDRRREDEASK
jgi:hypothetical protein